MATKAIFFPYCDSLVMHAARCVCVVVERCSLSAGAVVQGQWRGRRCTGVQRPVHGNAGGVWHLSGGMGPRVAGEDVPSAAQCPAMERAVHGGAVEPRLH